MDFVPFQPSQDGMNDGQWNPPLMICELVAETTPAKAAAAGRRIPNRTTVANHTSPTSAGVLRPVTFLATEASSTPPNPASAAASPKILSFVATGDAPEVAAASSAVRTATMARPDEDRSRLRI